MKYALVHCRGAMHSYHINHQMSPAEYSKHASFFSTHSSTKIVLIKSNIVGAVLDSSSQSSMAANATVGSVTPDGFAGKLSS